MSNNAPVPEPRGSAEDRLKPLPLTPSEAEALRAAVERIIRAEEKVGRPKQAPEYKKPSRR